MIPNPITVPMTVSGDITVSLKVESDTQAISMGLATAIAVIGGEHYTGPYEVTPSAEETILETTGLIMESNVTVNPIPSNYGLITWDGAILTVS